MHKALKPPREVLIRKGEVYIFFSSVCIWEDEKSQGERLKLGEDSGHEEAMGNILVSLFMLIIIVE